MYVTFKSVAFQKEHNYEKEIERLKKKKEERDMIFKKYDKKNKLFSLRHISLVSTSYNIAIN